MRNKLKLSALGVLFAAVATVVSVCAAVFVHWVVWLLGGSAEGCAFMAGWAGCFSGLMFKDVVREAST